jgi:hypothetical protein
MSRGSVDEKKIVSIRSLRGIGKVKKLFLGTMMAGLCAAMVSPVNADDRVHVSKKGSLLMFSKVELVWYCAPGGCRLVQDTFLDMSNDFQDDVYVQLYFVNGDEPTEAVFAGDPPVLVEREHPGWNWVDCQILLTANQPTYWSAYSGLPAGCQPFTVLDPGYPPGRPNTDVECPTDDPNCTSIRRLRGMVYAWAVDNNGEEINWNHLTGDAMIVNYYHSTAWEYEAYAAQALLGDNGDNMPAPGVLELDGVEYDIAYDKLLMDFYATSSRRVAVGAQSENGGPHGFPFSGDGCRVANDSDITLYPVSQDLRQDNDGPIYTKAKFDVWNQNEVRFSGLERCITCWDQTLASNYDDPNYFLVENLHTDKGKARIDGMASTQCPFSVNAALLGVTAKEVIFLCGVIETPERVDRGMAGRTLVGQGEEAATIQWDIIAPPGTLQAPMVGEGSILKSGRTGH